MCDQNLEVFKTVYKAIETCERKSYASETVECNLFFKNNPDGTPRWFWPSPVSKPVFLKFYNASTFKAKLVVTIIKILFKLKLQSFFASGNKTVQLNSKDFKIFLELIGDDWSLFTGTAGVNRSALFHGKKTFYKIPVGEHATALLLNEYDNLKKISGNKFSTLQIPAATFHANVLQLTDVAANGRRVNMLREIHWKAFAEITSVNKRRVSIKSLDWWNAIDDKLSKLNDERISKSFLQNLLQLKASINASTEIEASFCHGDFTPWNMFVKNNQLALIDWELAEKSMPVFFDIFHFIYQQASLVDHCSYNEIIARLQQAFSNPVAKNIISKNVVDVELHHKLYLLFIITYYTNKYAQQANWHPQVKMSFDCWNNALNKILVESDIAHQRKLLLNDIFDFLSDKKYAALKWLCNHPSELSETSDIDICVTKHVRNQLKNFLQQHVCAKNVHEKRKSFMSSFTILLNDGSIVCIDTILSFKRKSIVMLDAKLLIETASINKYGIKIPSVEQDFSYMWLFYLLNNASVPERYQQHYDNLCIEQSMQLNDRLLWKKKLGIDRYQEFYMYNIKTKNIVVDELKEMKMNKGINKILNHINYVIDTVKDNFYKKGFIITFSGVDGAGKSTVIEKVRYSIEKKYRRKVVVLRHRPAVLPMLSAWKEGRKAAEQKAAERLPRQGNNNKFLSSLIRFAYYYADYLVGQFVVQFKYVLRGYIVLYDRYYFDFINDGKRSNIQLPRWFTKSLYALLLKPSYNFFLYADANTILQRKKELDKHTITILTTQYLNLFQQLNRYHLSSKYIPIENADLPQTLEIIFQHVKQKTV